MQVVGRADRYVVDASLVVGSAHLVEVPVETLELGEKVSRGEVTVDDAHGVVRIKGCHQIVARGLDGLHVPRGDVARGANKRKIFH